MDENGLRVGGVYQTIVGMKPVGKAIYIGRDNRKNILYRNVVILRFANWVEAWKFNDNYELNAEKLKLEGTRITLSNSEMDFVNERLVRGGL